MATENPNVSLRKRQQIEDTGKMMFMWVAIASALVAIAVVVSASLVERLIFNQRIINEMGTTAANLRDNNDIVDDLRASIRARNTNQALVDTPKLESAEPLSVVLDALPAGENSPALGASLQQKLLNVPGVNIEALAVGSVSSGEDTEDSTTSSSTGDNSIEFSFKVSSNDPNKIEEVLRNLERSIRVFDLKQISIEQQEGSIILDVTGVAYYSPEVMVELKQKSISPSSDEGDAEADGKS
jgi:hypothetical protein